MLGVGSFERFVKGNGIYLLRYHAHKASLNPLAPPAPARLREFRQDACCQFPPCRQWSKTVAEVLVKHCPVPQEFVGIEDTFTESGDYEKLLAKYGLSAAHIADKAEKVLRRKR